MSDDVNDQRRPSLGYRLTRSPWFNLLLVLVVLSLVQGFLVKVYQVPSGSMEPTLQVGDRMLANRLAYLGEGPEPGDVVVFAEPESWRDSPVRRSPLRSVVGWFGTITSIGPSNTNTLVKRVVAAPGQTIKCCDAEGHMILDDSVLPSPSTAYDLPFEAGVLDCDTIPASRRCLAPFQVPPDNYLVLGDHRNASGDSLSRCRGTYPEPVDECVRLVPRDTVVGEVFTIIFPPSRWTEGLDLTDR